MYICVKHKKKGKNKTLYPPLSHAHTENTVNFHNLSLSAFPFSLPFLSPSTTNGLCLLSRPFPDIRFYFLLSSLSPLSICLSVCLSVRHSPLHTLTHTISQPHSENHSHSPRSLTRSLTHPLSLTHWLGFSFFFFFYSIHDDCTCVTTWTCKIGHLSCCLVLFIFFSCEAKIDQQKKIYVALQILTQIEKYEMACV